MSKGLTTLGNVSDNRGDDSDPGTGTWKATLTPPKNVDVKRVARAIVGTVAILGAGGGTWWVATKPEAPAIAVPAAWKADVDQHIEKSKGGYQDLEELKGRVGGLETWAQRFERRFIGSQIRQTNTWLWDARQAQIEGKAGAAQRVEALEKDLTQLYQELGADNGRERR